MKSKTENVNLDDYLKPTKMCDSDNQIVIQKAQALTEIASTDKEKAKAIFYFIRDEIEFYMSPYFGTASNTLKQGNIKCFPNKSLEII